MVHIPVEPKVISAPGLILAMTRKLLKSARTWSPAENGIRVDLFLRQWTSSVDQVSWCPGPRPESCTLVHPVADSSQPCLLFVT